MRHITASRACPAASSGARCAAARSGSCAGALGAADVLGRDARLRRRRGRHRRPVVAALQRPDRTRHGDAVAEGGDREEFRRQADRHGRRHPDRARRERPHLACACATSSCATPTAPWSRARRKPKWAFPASACCPARCARKASIWSAPKCRCASRPTAASPCSPAPTSGRSPPRAATLPPAQPGQPADATAPQGPLRAGVAGHRRHAGLDRRPGRDRSRRPRSARTRPQERQSDRRRSAQRQALDLQPDQCELDAAGRRAA